VSEVVHCVTTNPIRRVLHVCSISNLFDFLPRECSQQFIVPFFLMFHLVFPRETRRFFLSEVEALKILTVYKFLEVKKKKEINTVLVFPETVARCYSCYHALLGLARVTFPAFV
jgi:hypothetical protein